MRDNVINLKVCYFPFCYTISLNWDIFLILSTSQVVLANGDVVKTASRARKSAAGFVLLSI